MMFDVLPSAHELGSFQPPSTIVQPWFLGDEKNWMSNIEKIIPTKVEKKMDHVRNWNC